MVRNVGWSSYIFHVHEQKRRDQFGHRMTMDLSGMPAFWLKGPILQHARDTVVKQGDDVLRDRGGIKDSLKEEAERWAGLGAIGNMVSICDQSPFTYRAAAGGRTTSKPSTTKHASP